MPDQPSNNQQAHNSQYVAQAADGGTATVNVHYHANHERVSQLVALQQRLPHFDGYIERPDQETRLKELLKPCCGSQYVLLHGISGAGKTWLAMKVINDLQDDELPQFPGGILWGSLGDMEPVHLLHYALGALQHTKEQASASRDRALREQFWAAIQQQQEQMLVVFDNVQDEHQLMRLLPSETQDVSNCCILVICNNGNLTGARLAETNSDHSMWLSGFSKSEEVYGLFEKHLRLHNQELAVYHQSIDEIARHLGGLPLLLTAAARDMYRRKIPPGSYARSLKDQPLTDHSITHSIIDGLKLIIRDFSEDQRRLFLLLGVLGRGSWSADMLAAVAVRRPEEMRQDLEALVERNLVYPHPTSSGRFQVNEIIQEFAQTLLEQQPMYLRKAAFICLAHYCLTLAHAQVIALRETSRVSTNSTGRGAFFEKDWIMDYRQKMLPEFLHIERVIEWARQERNWALLLRFADVAFAELLDFFIANSFETHMRLALATLWEPIVWRRGPICEIGFQALVGTERLQCILPREVTMPEPQSVAWRVTLEQSPDESGRCEIDLDIRAGQIIDGLFEDAHFFETEWLGVRAQGLISRNVQFIGCVFAGCDLSQSTWIGGHARQIVLTGSNLSHSLLADLEMHRANLEDAILTGASLEQVRLRGANLRNADFTDALLEHVDLRGADLRGACFKRATLRAVNLRNCRFEDVDWTQVQLLDDEGGIELDEELHQILKPVCSLEHAPLHSRISAREKLDRISQSGKKAEVQSVHNRTLNKFDLRGAHYTDDSLTASQCIFYGTDLRGANIPNADVSLTDFREANLRAASLQGANLTKATLTSADLRTTDLTAVTLQGADLSRARLRMAWLERSKLQHARLYNADLREVRAASAILKRATLADADLSGADFSDAVLDYADLQRATLVGTRFCGASLRHVKLDGADCTNADFRGARVLLDTARSAVPDEETGTDAFLVKASEWQGAILPDGRKVWLLDGTYQSIDALMQDGLLQLRLAYLTGNFSDIELVNCDLFGAWLSGNFEEINFTGSLADHARLTGMFANCDFSGASLNTATISGSFTYTDFREANLDMAELGGVLSYCDLKEINLEQVNLNAASLTNCNLSGAGVKQSQLKRLKRLRGTTMPDGSLYDGSLRLEGDKQDAIKYGYDLNSAEDQESFFKPGPIKVRINR